MSPAALERLHRRARAIKVRARVRQWEYRQRNLAAGVWFRLRRMLADASDAFAISEQEADRLMQEGHAPEPCGSEISPPKRLIFVEPERLEQAESRQRIRVGLGPDFLAAPAVALVRFRSGRSPPSGPRAASTGGQI